MISRRNLPSLVAGRRCKHTEAISTHEKRLRMLDPPELNLTYPPGSNVLNPRHFYQVHIAKWLEKPPHPVSIKQMIGFGKQLNEKKLPMSANFIAEELTVRFAHRLRQMQTLPYRIMSNPYLSRTYETYVHSFEMLRKTPPTTNLIDNERFLEVGRQLLTSHTRTVADIIGGMLDLMHQGVLPHDIELLNELVKTLLTSRLSRRVMVKQHLRLTDSVVKYNGQNRPHYIGEVYLKCTIAETVEFAEKRARQTLASLYPEVLSLPKIEIEGEKDVTFPYIRPHLDFIIGEVLRNSLEACMKTGNTTDPIVISVSSSESNVFVRISDRGGGIVPPEKVKHIWSFAKPLEEYPNVDNAILAEHGFYDLLFPAKDLNNPKVSSEEIARNPEIHFGVGLALARLYIEYWGGTMELHSLDGFGCDVLLRFSRHGSAQENLRFQQ